MRYLFGFLCVCALSVVPLVGCSETAGDGGSGGTAGNGGTGGADLCEGVTCQDTECKADGVCNPSDGMCDFTLAEDGTVCTNGECLGGVCAPVGAFPCTEQGIVDAIAEGGGPHFFACDGTKPVVTTEPILIDNDVILDGEGKLTVDGNANDAGEGHTVFIIAFSDIAVELRGMGVTGGGCPPSPEGAKQAFPGCFATGILVDNLHTASQATLTLANCVVSDNEGIGIEQNVGGTMTLANTTVSDSERQNVENRGVLTVINSTISNGRATEPGFASGIRNVGQMTMINSTVSVSEGVAIHSGDVTGTATLTNCTVSSDAGGAIEAAEGGRVALGNTVIDGDCSSDAASQALSNGYNIESPGNTCGFDQQGDQSGVTEGQLVLGPLQDNGGDTMTHALGAGSVAIDHIPAVDCEMDEDQRGEPRPGGTLCDVGAFEVQPAATRAPCPGCLPGTRDCTEIDAQMLRGFRPTSEKSDRSQTPSG